MCGETGDVTTGSLDCGSCGRSYAIEGGAPRLIVDDNPVEKSFAFQWARQLSGGFESDGNCFALDPSRVVDALTKRLPDGAPEPGSVIVDAGCGLGEKAAILAERFPDCEVVAFDLTPSVCHLRERYPALPNLHFVQADLNRMPFVPAVAHVVLSIGVIHHTADPHRSFRDLARLVRPGRGHLMLWVYLDPADDPSRKRYYWRRDVGFLGLGHVLPLRLAYWLCYAYTAAFATPAYFARRAIRRIRSGASEPDIYARMPLRDQVRSMAFVLFDDVTPRYQFRLRCDDVAAWFTEAGLSLEDGFVDGTGLFVAHHETLPVNRSHRGSPTRSSHMRGVYAARDADASDGPVSHRPSVRLACTTERES